MVSSADGYCSNKTIQLISSTFEGKIVNIILPISYNICFGCSIEPSHWDGSFEHPQHMFWLRNKIIFFGTYSLLKAWHANFKTCILRLIPTRMKWFTCNLPSRVLCIVTHFDGWAPLVVIAVIRLSSSSLFSFNFLTRDSMARLAKDSLSPPCLWHIKLCTMLRHASADVGACDIIDIASGFFLWRD